MESKERLLQTIGLQYQYIRSIHALDNQNQSILNKHRALDRVIINDQHALKEIDQQIDNKVGEIG